jgi:hypothetical protein
MVWSARIFLGQGARTEAAVEETTGYAVEWRAEGSGLITSDRAFTDVPFPTDATVEQAALLLCDTLAARGRPDRRRRRGPKTSAGGPSPTWSRRSRWRLARRP